MEKKDKVVIEIPLGSYVLDIAYSLEERLRTKESVLKSLLESPADYSSAVASYQREIEIYKSLINQLREQW